MTSRTNNRRRMMRGGSLAVVTLGAALPFALSAPAMASTGSAATPALISESSAAMTTEGSVDATGAGTVSFPGVGKVAVVEKYTVGPTSGSQLVKITALHHTTTPLPSASILDVNGAVYVKGNAAYWTDSANLTSAQSTALAGQWIQIPSTSSLYSATADGVTMATLPKDVFGGTTYKQGATSKVNGQKVTKFTYTDATSGPTTVYVATSGKHLPVALSNSGLQLHFSSWGKAPTVTAPSGATPLPAADTGDSSGS